MKKINKPTIIIFVPVLLLAFAGYFFTQRYSVHGNPIVHMKIKDYRVRSEEVTDKAKQGIGLGGRSGLCSHCGMLFVFDGEKDSSFWMKNMRFAIDILWIDNRGNVVHLERDVPYSDQRRIYVSDKPAHMVLELPAGTCEREGISEGSQVAFE